MISLARCRVLTGLSPNEMFLGAGLSAQHKLILAGYLQGLSRGPGALRKQIVSDIRTSVAVGATHRAADLLVVLRMYLAQHPESIAPQLLKISA